jgi:hypothetical protein
MLYNTSKILNVSESDLFQKVTEYDVYSYYIGGAFKIGKIFNSPIRQDNNPSFGIFKSKATGSLMFKDLATGDTGNCIKLVRILFNLTYKEALMKINLDFKAGLIKVSEEGIYTKNVYKPRNSFISIKRIPFSKQDLIYWGSYSIKKSTLDLYQVTSTKVVWLDEDIIWRTSIDNPIYAYKVYDKFKCYRPKAEKDKKWISNLTSYHIQGFQQLPTSGNLLIITKALKDVMVLHELGYNAIAPNGENHSISTNIVEQLKERFNHIVLLYDRDEAGLKGTRKLFKEHNFNFIFIPKKYKTKDISDFTQKYNKDKTEELLNSLLKKYNGNNQPRTNQETISTNAGNNSS